MNDNQHITVKESGSVNLGRHKSQCHVCQHPQCQQIEEYFINWGSTELIAKRYGPSRDSMYRHVHALDLFSKRRRNIRMALDQIIERLDFTPMSGSQIVSAIKAYAKINSAGQEVEPMQGTNPKELLERMSQEEREAFARGGSLPAWFSDGIGATPSDGHAGENESAVTETKGLQ